MGARFDIDDLPAIPVASRWRGGDFATLEDVVVEIELGDLAAAAARLAAQGAAAEDLTTDDIDIGAAFDGAQTLLRVLRDGRGFAIVRGFPVDTLDRPAVEIMFWRLGLELGRPVSQSVMGERLGHVIDHTDHDPDARAYRRNEALTPHTDPADYLAFLCLRPAGEGGDNHFVSSLEIHETIRRYHPDRLARLYRGFRYSRFGEQADNEEPITPYPIPVFSAYEGEVSCLLVRQYIEIAVSEDASCALDDEDREALDLVESLALDPELALTFTLQPGEAVFANNFTVMHARTGFYDPPGAPKRHLLRLWLDGSPRRPIRPEMMIYPNGPGVPPQPGRLPSYASDVEVL